MRDFLTKALSLALLLCIIFNLGACSFIGGGPTADEPQEDDPVVEKPQPIELDLELMSFNIRINVDGGEHSWDNRKDKIVSYLKARAADVICLQEVVTAQYEYIRDGVSSKYDVIHYRRAERGSEGLAIAYDKEKFELIEQRMFWLSETPDEMSYGWGAKYYRICVNVLLKHKETGAYLDVYNVHLDSESREARLNGIKLIMQKAEGRGYPIYLAGDFNDTIGSPCYQVLDGKLVDCQLYADETMEGTTWHDWGKIPDEKNDSIDFCFVSDDITPLVFRICRDKARDGSYYSDHYAVWTKVKMLVEQN